MMIFLLVARYHVHRLEPLNIPSLEPIDNWPREGHERRARDAPHEVPHHRRMWNAPRGGAGLGEVCASICNGYVYLSFFWLRSANISRDKKRTTNNWFLRRCRGSMPRAARIGPPAARPGPGDDRASRPLRSRHRYARGSAPQTIPPRLHRPRRPRTSASRTIRPRAAIAFRAPLSARACCRANRSMCLSLELAGALVSTVLLTLRIRARCPRSSSLSSMARRRGF